MVYLRAIVPVAILSLSVEAQVFLAPDQDIVLPSTDTATSPLTSLGGNGPWFAGPDVNGVSNKVPEGCYVEKVHSISRHGSRYPDSGAYSGWVALYNKIQAANFEGSGSLAFLKSWKPVLNNPTVQIATESATGWKEAYDLGYELRTRYSNLYEPSSKFIAWANLYPRVVATAQNFVRGFLGETAGTLGTVVTVDAKGANALFDSLGPSDGCPKYVDGNGGAQATQWDSIYLPPITKRFNEMLSGDLVLTDADVSSFPYLCGFESQITGALSPFCSTFTDAELEAYEYRQDLRYYYGSGPGTDLPSKMMLPYLNSVVELLSEGPGINGTAADGSAFKVPDLLVAFANDGQMNQLVGQLGVFDGETPLSGSQITPGRKFVASRFCSMRGTVTLERLQCKGKPSVPDPVTTTTTSSASACSTPSLTTKACNRDNCFRQMLQNEDKIQGFCGNFTTGVTTATTALPTFVSQCQNLPSRVSSACSCLVTPSATPCPTSSSTTSSATSTPTSPISNTAYLRVLLNDAVYPVAGCDKGPGKSCSMAAYKKLIGQKLKNAGDLKEQCGVTNGPAVLKGASFFRDLTGAYLATVAP